MVIGGNQTHPGDHFVMYINMKPVCCIPETNMSVVLQKKIIDLK